MKYVVLAIVIALVIFYFTRNSINKKAAAENIAIGKEFLANKKATEIATHPPVQASKSIITAHC
jgi:peptidylprolyl isomerase